MQRCSSSLSPPASMLNSGAPPVSSMRPVLLALVFGFVLCGCGAKGPLYIPTPEQLAEDAERKQKLKEREEREQEEARRAPPQGPQAPPPGGNVQTTPGAAPAATLPQPASTPQTDPITQPATTQPR